MSDSNVRCHSTNAGELAHKISCGGLPLALSWNPKHMLLGYSGQTFPPDSRSSSGSGAANVNVFAPQL